ncbi:sulfotransferase domain-containing protein [Alloalcanivorax profundimaris]|uniref:sulfotransferase domain-containing protein n=1 Tax=Alloalcanivorax profundimaris TaxID=2735259 RepID=UPI001888C743|nr:sulfotransferase domain-containing protein [Alloalcanivorax profundimaris]MBF1801808.1 hypothetical protein [Alloalcanivorax profundimaris]
MKDLIDVMIVGVEKAGTSALLSDIGKHENVAIPGKFKGEQVTNYDPEFSYFLPESRFKRSFSACFYDEFGDIPSGNHLVVAKNVGICYEPEAARRLREHNENTKLIILLREPVSRAYSSFWYQRYRGAERKTNFREAIEREIKGVDVDRHKSYLAKGLYFEQISRLERLFGSENLLIILHEQYLSQREYVLEKVFNFIGVNCTEIPDKEITNSAKVALVPGLARALYKDSPLKRLAKIIIPERSRKRMISFIRKANSSTKSYKPIKEEDKKFLIDYYKRDVLRVSVKVGDLEAWWPHFYHEDK